MKLIVGLGNPGSAYADSRHNIGFSVVKALAKEFKAVLKKEFGIRAQSAKIRTGAGTVVVALPLTYMNLSGGACLSLIKKYKVNLEDVLIVYDDLDLEPGSLRLKLGGSSGGHRGMQSIIDTAGADSFSRLRIGIGRPPKDVEAKEYVLTSFSKKEKEVVKDAVEKAVDCAKAWVAKGLTQSMNLFNRRSTKNE